MPSFSPSQQQSQNMDGVSSHRLSDGAESIGVEVTISMAMADWAGRLVQNGRAPFWLKSPELSFPHPPTPWETEGCCVPRPGLDSVPESPNRISDPVRDMVSISVIILAKLRMCGGA